MKKNITQQEKISNRIVILSSFIILYALLLMFFRKMTSSPVTVLGAQAFMEFLKWASLVGAMLCAAWSAYKDRKGYYLYTGMCLYIFLSMYLIRANPLNDDRKPYAVTYVGLAVAFVLTQVYSILESKKKFNGGWKIAFLAVLFSSITVLAVAAMEPRFWDLLPF